jgi:hypothetical protein
VVEAFQAALPDFQAHYEEWDAWAAAPPPGSQPPRMVSNTVLKHVAPSLKAKNYAVEETGSKQSFVVLWGENGRPEKTYHADAKKEHAPGRETVVEVEAGGATANNAWRKDLMEACLMPYVDYLVIAVRNEYRSLDRKGTKLVIKTNADFRSVTAELDALYESHRLTLPLAGILVIGY